MPEAALSLTVSRYPVEIKTNEKGAGHDLYPPVPWQGVAPFCRPSESGMVSRTCGNMVEFWANDL